MLHVFDAAVSRARRGTNSDVELKIISVHYYKKIFVYSSYMLIVRLLKNLVTLTSTVPTLLIPVCKFWSQSSSQKEQTKTNVVNLRLMYSAWTSSLLTFGSSLTETIIKSMSMIYRKNNLRQNTQRTKQEFADIRYIAVQFHMLHFNLLTLNFNQSPLLLRL